MNILVTGSSGFVGSLLVQALEKKGHTVEGFDATEGKDILNREQVQQAVQEKDVVFHLAAVLDETAGNLWDVNVRGTQHIIDACINERIDRLVHLSTMGVVGESKGVQDEQTECQPVTPYEKSKKAAEEKVLNNQEVISVSVVRPPIIYGPGSYWLKVIGYAKKNYPLIGDGNNAWQMIYVKDLVSALVFVLENDDSSGEVFTVAEEQVHTLKEVYMEMRAHLGMEGIPSTKPKWLAKLIAYPAVLIGKLTGKKPFISPSMVERAVRSREYNTAKIREMGWKPKYTLKQGMAETFKEIKARKIKVG